MVPTVELDNACNFGFNVITDQVMECVPPTVDSAPPVVTVKDEGIEDELTDEPSVGSFPCFDDALAEDFGDAGGDDADNLDALEDCEEDFELDITKLKFDFEGEAVPVTTGANSPATVDSPVPNVERSLAVPISVDSLTVATGNEILHETTAVNIRGMRSVPEPSLFAAGKGVEEQNSRQNDRWSLRKADKLRSKLNWDMSVAFVDLPFKKIDELLSNLFSRVTKANGEQYPGASLVNLMNGFNRMLRRAYDIRVLKGIEGKVADRDFSIRRHRNFMRTRLVINAAIKKGGREGANKKVKKAPEITLPMEQAIFIDLEHQVTVNTGCQKRLAAYMMLRIGVRRGKELWQMKRDNIKIDKDARGREYVQFDERNSKNNQWNIDRTKEHQFRMVFYSYEPDFILTVKQYYRHLAPSGDGVAEDMFTSPIHNPVGVVWYNRKHKVSIDRSSHWLCNMLKLVGLDEKLFSNRSGRVALITNMAARGVPDEVGMLVNGHHTLSGYSRYDRTKHLKQEAATLVNARPDLDYASALKLVTEEFKKQTQECAVALQPLVGPKQEEQWAELETTKRKGKEKREEASTRASSSTTTLNQEPEEAVIENLQNSIVPMQVMGKRQTSDVLCLKDLPTKRQTSDVLCLKDLPTKMARWHEEMDGIDWDSAIQKDPIIARALGQRVVNAVTGNSFSNMQNCTIQIICQQPSSDIDKENSRPLPGSAKSHGE